MKKSFELGMEAQASSLKTASAKNVVACAEQLVNNVLWNRGFSEDLEEASNNFKFDR